MSIERTSADAAINLAERPQTRKACQAVVRHIWQQNLEVGSRLAPTQQLGRELGICMNTLQSAMKVLADSVLIERRRKKGTLVHCRRLGHAGPKLFSVGLLWRRSDQGVFSLGMFKSICEQLQRNGCEDRTYSCDFPYPDEQQYSLNRVVGLQQDIAAGRVDGLISPMCFNPGASGLPICHIAMHHEGTWGAMLDKQKVVRQGLMVLLKSGCKRPAVIYSASHAPQYYHLDAQAAQASMAEAGLTPADDNLVVVGREMSQEQIIDQLVTSRRKSQRPDGLVITDDHRAHDLAQRLRDLGEQPLLAVLTNKGIPFRYALPVIRFEFDLEEHAAVSVRLLVDHMLGIGEPSQIVRVAAHLAYDDLPADLVAQLKRGGLIATSQSTDI